MNVKKVINHALSTFHEFQKENKIKKRCCSNVIMFKRMMADHNINITIVCDTLLLSLMIWLVLLNTAGVNMMGILLNHLTNM